MVSPAEEAKNKIAEMLIDTIDKYNFQGDDIEKLQEDEEGMHDNSKIEEMTFIGDEESTFFSNIKGSHMEVMSSIAD